MPTGADGFDPARLRRVREAAGLSQAAVARMLSTPRALVSEWENGATTPSVTSLRRVAAALEVPVAALQTVRTPTLAHLRVRAGLRQVDLAARIGESVGVIERLERRRAPLTPARLARLVTALEVSSTAIERAYRAGEPPL